MALLACIYGAANVFLAVAWQRILAFLQISVDWHWATSAYGVSQLAKYLPGNIFQFAGRQAIGMAAGLAARPLLQSTLYELGLLAAAGAFFGILVLPLLSHAVPEWSALLLFSGAMAVLGWGLKRYVSHHLTTAWGLHGLFLAVSSLVFWSILAAVSHADDLPVAGICGAYVLAWLIGLATPGAPAGVGVREAVLLFLLGTLVPPSDLVLAIVIGRMVTVVGDLLFFSICLGIRRARI
ncbi:lysylphosphatidylglycerol synthase domain-containing protein [Comamonas humi]